MYFILPYTSCNYAIQFSLLRVSLAASLCALFAYGCEDGSSHVQDILQITKVAVEIL